MAYFYRALCFALLVAPSGQSAAQSVRPGDRLVVKLLGTGTPFGDTLVVSPTGTVVLAKLGTVSLEGIPLPLIADSLRSRYAYYLRNPTVDVVVLRRVILSGEVRRPDIYYVDLNMSVPDAIAHAGGVTDASNNKVSIRRGQNVIPVGDWQTTHASVAELQSGDQIIVGRRPWLLQNLLPAVSTAVVVTSLLISLKK